MQPLDRLDHRILDVLQRDGRVTNLELSDRVGLSPTATSERLRRLVRDGYIVGFGARLRAELACAERTGNPRVAPGLAAARCTRRDLLTRHSRRLADGAPRSTAHQIHMDVIVVIDVGARRQHRGELATRGAFDIAQEALLRRQPLPAVLHRNIAPVRQCEARNVERIAKRVL